MLTRLIAKQQPCGRQQGRNRLWPVGTAVLTSEPMFPYGVRLHKELVWQTFQELYAKSDVLLIDWGDTARLDNYRTQLREQVAKQLEQAVFRDVVWLLERSDCCSAAG